MITSVQAGPLRVSVEGINGVGKTSAAQKAAALLGARGVLLDELTDQVNDVLPSRVIATLSGTGDPFLRTGHPVVETLALLALQVRKTERLTGQHLAGVDVILEDRGVDSVAVYQAAILCSAYPAARPEQVARRILADARRWCVLPDKTLLLTGDPEVCTQRFGHRIERPLSAQDAHLITEIDRLYRVMADDDPQRYIVLDVADLSPQETVGVVHQTVTGLLEGRRHIPAMRRPSA
jgi:dTMP kinase